MIELLKIFGWYRVVHSSAVFSNQFNDLISDCGAIGLPAIAEEPKLFDRQNLVAWCIVPFDNQKRTPEQRAAMVAKMGLTKVAYDWRQEHVAEFEPGGEPGQRVLAHQAGAQARQVALLGLGFQVHFALNAAPGLRT